MKKTKCIKRIVAWVLSLVMLVGIFETGSYQPKAYAEINYAKLLQCSLYFYDANMCGKEVSKKSLLNWRGNCHTNDTVAYTRRDGSTVNVDVTGGFHDAGDHVKFGLPEAYSAFMLGMSYDTDKSAYTGTGQVGHLKNITTHFSDYFVKCTVLDASGNVEAFCCQVGQGGGGFDHGYWGAPENQVCDRNSRPIFFANASAPSTDIVSLSAAALAMQYKNFGGDKYLTTAKKLFEFAKNNNKATNQTAGSFYASSGWADDYCLAALILYTITGDSNYKNEYDRYSTEGKAQNIWWPLGWDNVAPAVYYYSGRAAEFSNLMNNYMGRKNPDGYVCVDSWGSARYNTSMQYTGLLYDKKTGSSTYRSWAEGQMAYILGNNSSDRCYVTGYSSNSVKYPHHRAATGYTGGTKGTTPHAHTLIGALVGGPMQGGSYTDTTDNFQCNEVAIDYNACLVAATAALYSVNKTGMTDASMYNDGPQALSLTGVSIASQDRKQIVLNAATNYADISKVQFAWYASKDEGKTWTCIKKWTKGASRLTWKPAEYGEYTVLCKAKNAGTATSKAVTAMCAVSHHPYIKDKCQMPYWGEGGGYLIGFESYENPNQEYKYEMFVMDLTLYSKGVTNCWVHRTGAKKLKKGANPSDGKTLWTVWQPQYGYYLTLFRLYDKKGKVIDEVCYGFVNAY